MVAAVGLGVAVAAGEVAWRRLGDPGLVPGLVPLVVGAAVLAAGLAVANVRYQAWRFELTDDWIQARWGVVTHHTATIPRNRVQTMTSENGPIDRYLGLTTVVVHTAGARSPDLRIPHLDDSTVTWLRSELARGPR